MYEKRAGKICEKMRDRKYPRKNRRESKRGAARASRVRDG
jgi:hypothetical protein